MITQRIKKTVVIDADVYDDLKLLIWLKCVEENTLSALVTRLGKQLCDDNRANINRLKNERAKNNKGVI